MYMHICTSVSGYRDPNSPTLDKIRPDQGAAVSILKESHKESQELPTYSGLNQFSGITRGGLLGSQTAYSMLNGAFIGCGNGCIDSLERMGGQLLCYTIRMSISGAVSKMGSLTLRSPTRL